MKKTDLAITKHLLERALSTLPQSNSMRDLRLHISRALHETEVVGHKMHRRSGEDMTPRQKWELDLKTSTMISPVVQNLPANRHQLLSAIDEMIGVEKKKIEELQSGKQTDDEQDLGTILD